MKTVTNWRNDLAFNSEFEGHAIELNGGTGEDGLRLGFSPKALLLSGLAGCSGIDVVDILHKMKVPFTKLSINTEADQTADHPRVFEAITITFIIDAPSESKDKVERAVHLSLEKYCGVAAMLKKNSEIIAKVELIG